MRNWKRSLFFWTLVLLFLATAPAVILNARGYRFDISRGVFVYSGTITFKSNPQEVSAKLNNEEATDSKKLNRINASYNISGLIPGSYDLQILADGFQPWSKKTDVHSGLANEFWNVLLVKNSYDRAEINTPGINNFFISPKNDFFAYTVPSEQGLGVNVFNIENETLLHQFVFPGWNLIDKSKKENIEWSPEESFLSIPVERPEENKNIKNNLEVSTEYDYFIADLESGVNFSLKQFLGIDGIRNVRWDSENKGYLLFLSQNTLYRANMADASDLTKIAENISAFDISGNQAHYSSLDNNLIFRIDIEGGSQPFQTTSYFPGPENSSIEKIIVYDDSRIALILSNKNLYIFNKGEHDSYFKKLEDESEEAHFSDDGKKLLFWSGNEISVYFTRDENSQPGRKEDEKQNITRYSDTLRNVQWFNDYEHIIFSTGKWTKIIELDPRDRRNCMDLVNTQIENSFVIYDAPLEKLFFTDMKGDSMALYSIDFPENTSLLGAVGIGR